MLRLVAAGALLSVAHIVVPGMASSQAFKASVPTKNKAAALRALKSDGPKLYVCFKPLKLKKDTICVTVDELSRTYTAYGIAVAEYIRTRAAQYAERYVGTLQEGRFTDEWLRNPEFMGCGGQGETQGATYLAKKSLENEQGWHDRWAARVNRSEDGSTGTQKNDDDQAIAKACSGSMFNPISNAMAAAYAANDEMQTVLEETLACEAKRASERRTGDQGGKGGLMSGDGSPSDGTPPDGSPTDGSPSDGSGGSGSAGQNIKDKERVEALEYYAAKLWQKLVGAVGGSTEEKVGGNSTIGVRGYCFADMGCSEGSCFSNAQAEALKKVIREQKSRACNTNITPHPDKPNECSKENKALTAVVPKKDILEEYCRVQGGVMMSVDKQPICALKEVLSKDKKIIRPNDICKDPRAMCDEARVQGKFPVPGRVSGRPGTIPGPLPGRVPGPSGTIPSPAPDPIPMRE